jgi:hypothetical protein
MALKSEQALASLWSYVKGVQHILMSTESFGFVESMCVCALCWG